MSSSSAGRIIVAVIASYLAFGTLVAVTEQFLSRLTYNGDSTASLSYFVPDLITQCLYTVAAGYLCCVIARPSLRIAMAGLIGVGLAVGTVSLVTSWKSEPHWYGVALLFVYAPCVWIGWVLRGRANVRRSSH